MTTPHRSHRQHHSHSQHGSGETLPHGTLPSYLVGFALSIALTLFAFWAAALGGMTAVVLIVTAALLQCVVQLVFFLHLGKRTSPRSHQFFFLFTLIIVAIVVGGTLWIMHNLNHLHMQATMDDLYQGGVVAPQNELK